jgi:hypothetical protein
VSNKLYSNKGSVTGEDIERGFTVIYFMGVAIMTIMIPLWGQRYSTLVEHFTHKPMNKGSKKNQRYSQTYLKRKLDSLIIVIKIVFFIKTQQKFSFKSIRGLSISFLFIINSKLNISLFVKPPTCLKKKKKLFFWLK